MDFERALMAFDGKNTASLEAWLVGMREANCAPIEGLIGAALSGDSTWQSGATWLLKRLIETGTVVSRGQAAAVVGLLGRVSHWEARLHVLQVVPRVDLSGVDAAWLYERCLEGVGAKKTFVRAWSFGALVAVAETFPAYRPKVRGLIEVAGGSDSASVRARIRNAIKGKEWV